MVEMVGLVQEEIGFSDAEAQAKLAFLSRLDAVDAPLAARPGSLALSGHVQSCARYLHASETEMASFAEEYVESIGHYTVVPKPAGMKKNNHISTFPSASMQL